ncbi:MAG: methionyl-tRNA formyltransferase [Bacteroidota bacterium]
MRLIYFGTPAFAACSLERIVQEGYEVVAVVTAPDKPAGRGLQLRESEVKQAALRLGLPVLQPVNLKSEAFQAELRALDADLGVVIAFRMMPVAVWSMPRLGTFNLHASLLPAYRGAAPINRTIMNGEKNTGVTTFFLRHEIDTGDLLLQQETEIGPDETAGELHDRLMWMGADLVSATLKGIVDGNLQPKPQGNAEGLPAAPKIFQDDCRIDWNRSALEVHNQIRGLSPFPGAFTEWQGHGIKVYRSRMAEEASPGPGIFFRGASNRLCAGCLEGSLELLEVQPQGKKRMSASDFLNGWMK